MKKIAKLQRLEGEPTRMSRVQGMVEERWPKYCTYAVWIDKNGRHVCVKVDRYQRIDVVADTWLDAFDKLDVEIAKNKRHSLSR